MSIGPIKKKKKNVNIKLILLFLFLYANAFVLQKNITKYHFIL